MNCSEFRRLFADLLRDPLPEEFDGEAYRLHAATCVPCQLLLTQHEVGDTISAYAGSRPDLFPAREADAILRVARRKAAFRRFAEGATAVTAALLLASGVAWLLFPGAGPDPAAAARDPVPAIAAAPAPDEPGPQRPDPMTFAEFAEQHLRPGFELDNVTVYGQKRMHVVVFRRTSPEADQYRLAKDLALSGFPERFPDAPVLMLSVTDAEDMNILRIRMTQEALVAAARPEAAGDPPHMFLRRFEMDHDAEGRTSLTGE